jgi:hypothetical protein
MTFSLRRFLAISVSLLLLSVIFGGLGMNAVAAPPEPVEEWIAFYNGPGNLDEYGRAITTDALGNVYVTGRSNGVGTDRDIATIKYDTNGNQLWVSRFNGPGDGRDEPSDIDIDPFGNVIVTGWCYTDGTNYYDILVLKYDSAGNLLWQATYDGGSDNDHAQALTIDAAGNIYITGQSGGFGTHFDYITIKYDTAGNKIWEARYDGVGNAFDSGRDIELDSVGNVVTTGFTARVGWINFDVITIKYDSNGIELWKQIYNGPANSDDYGWTLEVDSSDNVYASGLSTGIGTGADCITISYDPAGTQRWLDTYDGPGNGQDQIYRSKFAANGNLYVTGRSTGAASMYDYITIAYDSAGTRLWFTRYDGPAGGVDEAYGIDVDILGNVYVSGHSLGGAGSRDAVTIGYDATGAQLWVKRFNGPGNAGDIAFVLALDTFGNLFASGRATIGGTNGDLLTIKYSLPLAAEAVTEMLISSVENLELDSGTENSLASKLDNAVKSLESDNDGAAVNQLESFQHQAEALDGTKLTTEEVDSLTGASQAIIDKIAVWTI